MQNTRYMVLWKAEFGARLTDGETDPNISIGTDRPMPFTLTPRRLYLPLWSSVNDVGLSYTSWPWLRA